MFVTCLSAIVWRPRLFVILSKGPSGSSVWVKYIVCSFFRFVWLVWFVRVVRNCVCVCVCVCVSVCVCACVCGGNSSMLSAEILRACAFVLEFGFVHYLFPNEI